jgi:hypothetical protein
VSVTRWLPFVALAATLAGCAASAPDPLTIDLARTRPAGLGRAFRPSPLANPAIAAAAPVGTLRCGREAARPYGAHIELFARDRGIVLPAGIGVAPPVRRDGAFVRGGRCSYPIHTTAPTGVVEIDPSRLSRAPTVGDLFVLWGQPLTPRRLGAFATSRGPGVIAFVNGRPWRADPNAIPLRRHWQVELELGFSIPPHRTYLFPAGL